MESILTQNTTKIDNEFIANLCFSASFASISNLFFRKSSERSFQNGYNYYLLFFYFTSLMVSFLIIPSKEPESFNPIMFGIGCVVGAMNMIMMWLTSQALLTGPAGLTFAFLQNVSGIFPGIILFSLFGPLFGFQISVFQIIGMGIVLWGLFFRINK